MYHLPSQGSQIMEDNYGTLVIVGTLVVAVVLIILWAWCVQKLWQRGIKEFWQVARDSERESEKRKDGGDDNR